MERFKEILAGWNFPKHAATVVSLYSVMATVGNLFFWLWGPKKRQSCAWKKSKGTGARQLALCVKELPKEQKIFNGVLAGCFLIDMTAGYFVAKALGKRMEE